MRTGHGLKVAKRARDEDESVAFTVEASGRRSVRIENSFIPVEGVGEATERRLWQTGIIDWDCFDPGFVGPKTGDRITDFIDIARDRLHRGDAAFFATAFPSRERWRMFENFRTGACYLDIETTGLSARHHDVTVVTLHQAGRTRTLVRHDDLDRDTLLEALAEVDLVVTFNGNRFDIPFLEDAFDVSIDIPHLDLLYPCRRLDLTGGLKHIERAIGIDRGDVDIGGRDAIRLWHAYRRGNDGALDRLIEYNRADTVNLEVLTEHVCTELHRAVFEASLDTGQQTF